MSQTLKFENEKKHKSYFEQDMPRAIEYLLKQKDIKLNETMINKVSGIVMTTLVKEAHNQGGKSAASYAMKTVDLNNLSNPGIDLQDLLEGAIKDELKEGMNVEQLQAVGDVLMTYIKREAKQTSIVDVNEELQHMITHVKATWDVKDVDLDALLKSAWEKALDLTKNEMDRYGFHVLFESWKNQREDYNNWQECDRFENEEQFQSVIYYDAINNFSQEVYFKTGNLHDIIRQGWDFSTVCDGLTKEMKKEFPTATALRPKGWKALEKNYNDFDGQEEYCESQSSPEFVRFQGVNSNSAGASGFDGRIALPYVMYDDKCQGRKPFYTLIGAVLGHAFFVNSQNNTLTIMSELEKIRDITSDPKYFKDLMPVFNPIELTDHNLTKALILLTQENKEPQTLEEFFNRVNETLKYTQDYRSLSIEEKVKKDKETQEYSSNLIDEILNELKEEEAQDSKEIKKPTDIHKEIKKLLNIKSQTHNVKKVKIK